MSDEIFRSFERARDEVVAAMAAKDLRARVWVRILTSIRVVDREADRRRWCLALREANAWRRARARREGIE